MYHLNNLHIISKTEFDQIPDKINLSHVSSLCGYYSKSRFFTKTFNSVNCTLSRLEYRAMDIGLINKCSRFNWCEPIKYFIKDDLICYPVDVSSVEVWEVNDHILIDDDMGDNGVIPLNDFKEALIQLCSDIDKRSVIRNANGRLVSANWLGKYPDSYKTVIRVIDSIFKTSEGTPNYNNIRTIVNLLPSLHIRVYPIVACSECWVSGCFEFSHNDEIYRLIFR